MDKKIIDLIKEKGFWSNIALFFLLECVLGVLVKLKHGNLDAYIGLLLPMLLVNIVMYSFASYKGIRKLFTISCMILLMIGVMMQCIIQNDAENFALEEQLFLIISLVAAIIFLVIYNRFFENMTKKKILKILFISVVVIYLLLLIVGHETADGTKAWIKIGGISVQLTEFIKIISVLFFTNVFCNEDWDDKKKFSISFGYLLLNGILSLGIKEMGSFLIMGIVFVFYVIIFLNSKKYILGLTGVGAVFCIAGVIIGKLASWYVQKKMDAGINITGVIAKISHEYDLVLTRLNTWINPELVSEAARNQGLRAQQGMAIGGWLGNKIKSNVFIPVSSSDFIFPEIIMNFGLLFGIFIVLLFAILFIVGVRMYVEQTDYRNMGMIAGSLFYITIQSFLMFFGSTGFFIMTGVPIAFISSGGTSMMTTFILTALILYSYENVAKDSQDKVWIDDDYIEREL